MPLAVASERRASLAELRLGEGDYAAAGRLFGEAVLGARASQDRPVEALAVLRLGHL